MRDASSAPSTADASLSLEEVVAFQVSALSPDDRKPRKAIRIYLHAVLAKALGQQRQDDAGFERMVDQVLAQMEGDASLAQALREAGDLLIAQAEATPPSGI
ncbi:MAG: hypothetical protein KJ901_21455 [Gammaproteobacteria bacterium]|nr:hypothetical protein [Gammaproteobacteria bacterium]